MELFSIKNFDPNKNYVIEASAGTGKTYNIVEMVDKLVNTYNEDLNSILIVTYTEKAAGELKSRIRDKIKNTDVDNAPIYTIHSFCQSAIKEFGLSANLPLNLNVIDDSEMSKFADRYLREGEIIKDISTIISAGRDVNIDSLKDIFIQATNKYYLDMDWQEDDTIVSLEESSLNKESIEFLSSVSKAETIEDLFIKYPKMEAYYKILLHSNEEKSRAFAGVLYDSFSQNTKLSFNGTSYNASGKWPINSEDKEAFEYFKKVKVSLTGFSVTRVLINIYLKDFYIKWQLEKEANKNQTFDDMIRYVREAILHDDKLKNKLKTKYKRAIIDEFQDTNQRQFDIFRHIFMEDDEHKIIVVGDPKQSIYSFQGADINVYYNAVKAIEARGGVLCMLNKNYRSTKDMVVSCNKLFNYYDFTGTEFVDCNFLNVADGDSDIHEVKYNNENTNAFWIVRKKFNPPLNNSESINNEVQKIIDCCSYDENKETELQDSKESYVPLNDSEFANIAVQQIIDCCSYDENGKTKLQVRKKDTKQFRNVSFKDFAVLARTSREMASIEKALKNAGIPYLRYKDTNLFLGNECEHWITVLEAINVIDFTGKNRRKLKKALFTKFFGLSIKEIDSEKYNQDDSVEVEMINRWKQYVYKCDWENLIEDIIISSGITERMKSLKEIQSLGIFKQIGNYCIEYLSSGKSLNDLIRNLTNLSKGGDFEGDNQNGTIVEKSTNFDCVQIMTIHASKGLQFPVVIGVCGFRKPFNHGTVFTCHKVNEETGETKQKLIFSRDDTYVQEEIAEWKRLFYVAYTRSQFVMILPSYVEYGAKFLATSIKNFENNHKDSYRLIVGKTEKYKVLREKTSEILSNTNKKVDDESKDDQHSVLKQLIKDSYAKKSYKHSYSSLSHEEETIVDEEETNKEGIIEEGLAMFDKLSKVVNVNYDDQHSPITLASDYPRGAKLGTALHEVFEILDFSNHQERLELIINRCFLNQGVIAKDEWIESTKLIVENVIHATLPIVHGSNVTNESLQLKEITLENKKDEVEFNFNLLKGRLKNYCNGFVDLIFKNGDYYSIVDWKSDNLSEDFESYSKVDSLKKHVDDCYSIQRVLYSYCLIKWLKMYMPTLSEQEIFDKHFGGIYYVFLRGCNSNTGNGIYCQTWNSYSDLEKSFNEIINAKVGGNENE